MIGLLPEFCYVNSFPLSTTLSPRAAIPGADPLPSPAPGSLFSLTKIHLSYLGNFLPGVRIDKSSGELLLWPL